MADIAQLGGDEVDPADVEVIRNFLSSAAAEMHRTVVRTAYSMIIYELEDFAVSLYDRDLNLIADSPGLAMFLGNNDYGIQKAVEYVGEENFKPGDIFVMNYPYWSSSHPNDVNLFAPIFYEGDLVGYAVILAHWLDIGAKDAGASIDSTNIHAEGVLFPGTKIYDGGERCDDIFELIRFNSRYPDEVIGDINAQIAAVRTGKARLTELYDRYGEDLVDTCIETVLDHGERQTRERLEEWPNGTWHAEDYLDDDGINDELVKVGIEVTIDGDELIVDFSESNETVEGPMNTPIGMTQSVCKLVLKSITTPKEPSNGGHYQPLEVIVPEDSIANATYPDPCGIPWFSIDCIETIYHALAKGMPEQIPASSGGDLCNRNMAGYNPRTERPFFKGGNEGVGWGASVDHDGESALIHITGQSIRNTPIEVMENQIPIRIANMRLRQDSGGPGRHRGGLGVVHTYHFLHEGEGFATVKKTETAGWGLNNGLPGAKNKLVWYPGTEKEEVTGTARRDMDEGDKYAFHSAGGGGYGDPHDRPAERVREDVIDGYVSRTAAEEIYGVALTDDLEIDQAQTAELRGK